MKSVSNVAINKLRDGSVSSRSPSEMTYKSEQKQTNRPSGSVGNILAVCFVNCTLEFVSCVNDTVIYETMYW